jgi:hypothetical protein
MTEAFVFAYATTRLDGAAEVLSQHLLSRVRVWRAWTAPAQALQGDRLGQYGKCLR